MDSTEDKIVTEVNLVQFEKPLFPIEVTPSSIITDFMLSLNEDHGLNNHT